MKNSAIEWTDHTFNPWEGCAKVSPGCAHCYAETRNARFGGGAAPNWGKGAPRRRTSAANWQQPRQWNRLQETSGAVHHGAARPRVFCASLADWLDDEVPIEWLADLLALIHETPHLDWLLLTKRPENWDKRVGAACSWMSPLGPYAETKRWLFQWLGGLERENHTPPANVSIGTTVEDQQRADERIPHLLNIPARVRFLSCEPLLGPMNLRGWLTAGGCSAPGTPAQEFHGAWQIDWLICGGESGHHARPMHPEWARSLRDQCKAAGVPFFFKQWGEWAPGECVPPAHDRLQTAHWFDGWNFGTQTARQSESCHPDDAPDLYRVGKKAAGRLLDGAEHSAFPAHVTRQTAAA